MAGSKYDVFLSYRRDGGSELAGLVFNDLRRRGYRAFMDVREMPSGRFDEALREVIDQVQDVVVLLTPGCLARCSDPEDWFRREIAQSLAAGRNVVPLRMTGFDIPPSSELPENIRGLSMHNMVGYSHEHSESAIDKLCALLKSRPRAGAGRSVLMAVLLLTVLGVGWVMKDRFGTKGAAPTSPVSAASLPGLQFTWGGYGERETAAGVENFTLQDGMTVYSGDGFRLEFVVNQPCYVYVVAIDAADQVSTLFPHPKIQQDNRCQPKHHYVLPERGWYRLDDKVGEETLFILASYDPLPFFDSLQQGGTGEEPQKDIVLAQLRGLEDQSAGEARTKNGTPVDATRSIEVDSDALMPVAAPKQLLQARPQLQLDTAQGLTSVHTVLKLNHVAPAAPAAAP